MDPLSDVLALLRPRSALSAQLSAGGNWAMRFPPYEGVKFAVIARGSCSIAIEGMPPEKLQAGDCYLLTDGQPYKLGSDLALPTADAREVFARAENGVAHYGVVASEFLAIGGRFSFEERSHANLLLDCLPPFVFVESDSPHAGVIHWVLDRLVIELAKPNAGKALMADHLVHILFIETLRAHLAREPRGPAGWLGALSDPQVGAALGLIHGNPAKRWKLDELASSVAMSRSTFAMRFKELTGDSPMDYLLRWRMRLACKELTERDRTVSSIAGSLGYLSDSAFSNAFKRVVGCAPKAYRVEAELAGLSGLKWVR
jgi:AraC-like DNA-binding protein